MSSLFATTEPPPIEASKIPPRPYQLEALEALDLHMRTKDTNPCVVLPTGSGKSLVIAWAVQQWKRDHPPFRCAILAHRKELVEQNAAELQGLWPGGDVGVYAAGLRRRDLDAAITYASIDSCWNRWNEFPPFDVLLIDEAHRIPAKGEGKYRSFINGCRKSNKSLRVAGFTATPHRLGLGPICHRDHILQEVCYEANVGDLIRDGYLCRLRSKVGTELPDLSAVKTNGEGDYVQAALAKAIDVPSVVHHAVREAMAAIQAEGRKSVVFFCVDVSHCQAVAGELRRYGLDAPIVTAKTKDHERDRIARGFKEGRYRALCNVNVFTEGFNAKRVDCVVLLRPTLSAGLYAQMVGRGLRLHPDKQDCLVLDFARCIETHGPIDCLEPGEVRVIVCGSVQWPPYCRCGVRVSEHTGEHEVDVLPYDGPPGCGDTFSRVRGACPHCGWVIPPAEVNREAAEQAEAAERKLHEAEAAKLAILGSEPEEVTVSGVTVHRHKKPNMPDSLVVQYRCGLSTFREWICLDHEGYAGRKARTWWARRFGLEEAKVVTVDSAVDDLFTAKALQEMTETITVVRRGRNYEILDHKLRSARTLKPAAVGDE